MMSSHHLMQIEKLKGRENFETWRVAAKSYLAIKDLWKFVDPAEISDVSPTENNKATAELTLLIQPIHYALIAETTTARAAWKILVDTFKDAGTSRKVNMLQRLVTLKKTDCASMEDYCSKMMEYWLKVKNVGFAIDSETVGALMLGGLPKDYQPMVMGLENSGKSLTADFVLTTLLQDVPFEQRNESSATAMYSKHK